MLPCVLLIIAANLAVPGKPLPVYSNGQYAYCNGFNMPLSGKLHGAIIMHHAVRYISGDLLCDTNNTWAGCYYIHDLRADYYELFLDMQPRNRVFNRELPAFASILNSVDISDHWRKLRTVPIIDPAVPIIAAHYGNRIVFQYADTLQVRDPHETIFLQAKNNVRILAQVTADYYIAVILGHVV